MDRRKHNSVIKINFGDPSFRHPKSKEKIDESRSAGAARFTVRNTYSLASFFSQVLFDRTLDITAKRKEVFTRLVEFLLKIYCERNPQKSEQINNIVEELTLGNLINLRNYQEVIVDSLEHIKKNEKILSDSELGDIISNNFDRILAGKSPLFSKIKVFQTVSFFICEGWELQQLYWEKVKGNRRYIVIGYYKVVVFDLDENKIIETFDFQEDGFLDFLKNEFNVDIDKYYC